MKKGSISKHPLLAMLVLFAILISASSNAFATITICFGPGNCYIGDGTCDGWCPDPPGTPTCSAALSPNPSTDYLLEIDGHAWLVQGTVQTPVASDNLMKFIEKMQRKFPAATSHDAQTQAEIVKAFADFMKKHDNGKVSPKRLKDLSKEMGVRIVHKDSKK